MAAKSGLIRVWVLQLRDVFGTGDVYGNEVVFITSVQLR
jgi:hypothetical protein